MATNEISEQQAFDRLAALCARGEHCQHDLMQKMRQWRLTDEEQARVMQRLVAGRYTDEARYASAFVREKVSFNHWGPRKVEQALWQKRIDEGIAREALAQVADADYVALLRPMLRQKQRSVTGRNDYERRMKLVQWAAGRGFTMQQIRQCIDTGNDDELLD